MRNFLKMQGFVFLLCNLFISLDMAIVGLILEPDAQPGYTVLFFPPLYAFLCTIPSFFMYSKKELTVKAVIVRRILQIITIEAIIIGFIICVNTDIKLSEIALIAVSILLVFLAVWLINWLRARMEANKLNAVLESLNKKQ